MAFEQKDMSGSLFKNDRKDSDSQPNAKGTAKIAGVEYWVSAWTNKDKNGNPWQALKFTPKEERPSEQPAATRPDAMAGLDDDIPF